MSAVLWRYLPLSEDMEMYVECAATGPGTVVVSTCDVHAEIATIVLTVEQAEAHVAHLQESIAEARARSIG